MARSMWMYTTTLAWFALCSPGRADPILPGHPLQVAEVSVENPPIFPLSEVQRGLEGVGYTVFESATGPEAFGFVVLGVMRSYLGPGEDLIIARLTGERIERTGVISGMSGSPVYIGGRLVGAVGYRFGTFTDDPIAGITPIERMLAVSKPISESVLADGRATESLVDKPSPALGPMRGSMASTPWGIGEPLALPIATAGLAPVVAEGFSALLRERGYGPLVPAAGAGGAAWESAVFPGSDRLFAAGPVAGVMVSGDLLMAAIGTVTWVSDSRFLAFGHPFMGIGQSEMPIFNAEIVTTVASKAGSWKMGQATRPMGRLTDDRLHAIGGSLGDTPSTMPMTVHLNMSSPRAMHNASDQMRFQLARHPTDTPLFAAMAFANAMTSRVGVERSGTLFLQGKVRLSTGDEVSFEKRTASDGGALEVNAALALLTELEGIVDNGFRDVNIAALDVAVRRVPEVVKRKVVGVEPVQPLMAGRASEVMVDLQPWEQASEQRRIAVRIPAGVPAGQYQLVAASPKDALRIEADGGLRLPPTSFAAWLDVQRQRPEDGTLSLYLVSDDPGIALDGHGLARLPASLFGILAEGGGVRGATVDEHVVVLARTLTDTVLDGAARARVYVSNE